MFAAIRVLRSAMRRDFGGGCVFSLLQSNMRSVAKDDVVWRYNECSRETEVEI